MYYSEELLFYKSRDTLFDYLKSKIKNIKQIIESQDENYILNVGQEQYIDHLVDSLSVDGITIFEDDIFADPKEEQIPSKEFPLSYSAYEGKSYLKPVLYFHIPYTGDKELFSLTPSSYSLNPPRGKITNNEIIKRFVIFDDDYQNAQIEFDRFKSDLIRNIENVNNEINSHNSSIRSSVEYLFIKRKEELLKRKQSLAGLTVPIRKKENVPQTFTIPSIKVKKKITVQPTLKTGSFVPDPKLDDETYSDILTMINDMGKQFERIPSVYSDKGEEDLRDHFLMLLEPHFDGSATGETFNKSGKTDILLRHDGGNVFVGECKFWTGAKGFLGTIDQLLGYLTWRDSKTSVIMFVRNKDFTNVIETAKESIQTHDNFIKFVDQKDESWFNYIFHLNGDKNKEIKVAIMLYHIPS
ncbi:hypothetical protein ABNX05_11280 [Lysinibacillus sp. M3]|uniref:Restriction endonuclease type IV Mrr domain-containing protein n=1 Tax=Lysinibacillus zambalensis TaxID=3160866 RepID=A0ABV1MRR0_9BACI